ncbi:MAG: hypothetical protein ACI9HK_006247, partial [Pirellulaceae bacterium]
MSQNFMSQNFMFQNFMFQNFMSQNLRSQNLMSPKLPTHVNGTELQYAEQWKESSKYFIHRSGDEVRIGFSVGLDDENVMPIHSQVSMS